MDNTVRKSELVAETTVHQAPRPRRMTSLELHHMVEQAQKIERLKAQLAAGDYHVDSRSVARAILNIDEDPGMIN